MAYQNPNERSNQYSENYNGHPYFIEGYEQPWTLYPDKYFKHDNKPLGEYLVVDKLDYTPIGLSYQQESIFGFAVLNPPNKSRQATPHKP
jgi:hypothetical protein